LSNGFGFELRLSYPYDFSKVTSCLKKIVAIYGSFSQLLMKFLKVGILFGGKHEHTRKFAGR
jgi:hypothetical protein